jgi:hypothetical protein
MNRLIKEAKFMLFNKITDAPSVAYIIMREVVATKSLLDE